MKHDYLIEATTASGRKFEIYGSYSNCVEASSSIRASIPGIRSLVTRLLSDGKPVDHYII